MDIGIEENKSGRFLCFRRKFKRIH